MRLIDADALILATQNFCDGYKVNWTNNKVMAWINSATTIDAVPVVRCKDCKYHRIMETKESFLWWHNCKLWCADIDEDDFCSYGERKE